MAVPVQVGPREAVVHVGHRRAVRTVLVHRHGRVDEGGGIVLRRHGDGHCLRGAIDDPIIRHHGDRAVRRRRAVARVVVEKALQDCLIHRRRGRPRDREHPRRRRIVHRQPRPGGRRRRRAIECE